MNEVITNAEQKYYESGQSVTFWEPEAKFEVGKVGAPHVL